MSPQLMESVSERPYRYARIFMKSQSKFHISQQKPMDIMYIFLYLKSFSEKLSPEKVKPALSATLGFKRS